MKGKIVNEANCVEYAGFEGDVSIQNHSINTTWIIDSGATINMYFDINVFDKIHKLVAPNPVILPDGSLKNIKHSGSICLHSSLYTMSYTF